MRRLVCSHERFLKKMKKTFDEYIVRQGKKLRCGFTTGSCAAAAAKAATAMLFTGTRLARIAIDTPRGVCLELPIGEISVEGSLVRCCVVKDAGDDPDVTDGIRIFAEAELMPCCGIEVTAGEGIGVVRSAGLPVEPGLPAINPVPMRMIREEVGKVLPPGAGVRVKIFAPEGAAIAQKTFNGRLGVIGGISILGTTGIVEPYSAAAMRDSFALELSRLLASGRRTPVFVPGNIGERFARTVLELPAAAIVHTGNDIGFMLDEAARRDVGELLLVGHLGKLVKVAGGIFDTHSGVADARLEILAAHYAAEYGDVGALRRIMACTTVEGALAFMTQPAFFRTFARTVAARCRARVRDRVRVEAALFSEKRGLLGMSDGAGELIGLARGEA